jgi:hypothetical protein
MGLGYTLKYLGLIGIKWQKDCENYIQEARDLFPFLQTIKLIKYKKKANTKRLTWIFIFPTNFFSKNLKAKLFGVLRNILKKWKCSCELEKSDSWCDPEKGFYETVSKTSVSMIDGKLFDQILDYQLLKHKLLKEGVRQIVSIISTVYTRICAI